MGRTNFKFEKKHSDEIYVSEYLIPAGMTLFHNLRVFAKVRRDKISSVFTKDRNIYLKNAITDKMPIIFTAEYLLKFKNDF